MLTLKGTKASLSYVQGFLYLVSSSINVSIFYIAQLDTFWTDLIVYLYRERDIYLIDIYHLYLSIDP